MSHNQLARIAGFGLHKATLYGARIMRAISMQRKHPKDNGYARPVEGVMAFVDLDAGRMIRLDDHGVVPMPPEDGNYDPESAAPLRSDLLPIEITQRGSAIWS